MAKKQHFVICYDIKNPRRLQRVQRLVSKHLLQLQHSIYYGTLFPQEMDKLIAKLQKIIANNDDVKVYQTQSLENAFIKGNHSTDIMLFGERGERIFW